MKKKERKKERYKQKQHETEKKQKRFEVFHISVLVANPKKLLYTMSGYKMPRRMTSRRRRHVLKLEQSIEYFESSMESCTQALSILSRVWKVVLKL